MTATEHDSSVPGVNAVFRNVAAMPTTASARSNCTNLVRATQDVGYAAVAKATGHDKSWITRFFQEESRANLPEIMCWLDAVGLRITPADVEREDEADLLQILLRKVAVTIERRQADRSLDDARQVRLDADDYRALLALAKRGVVSMQTGMEQDRCAGCERA